MAWNLFAASRSRTALVSTYDVRSYADEAGRAFEAAVMFLIAGQLLVELNPRLGYHDDRGCMFDETVLRSNLVLGLHRPLIEPSCLTLIAPRFRDAANEIARIVANYRRRKRP